MHRRKKSLDTSVAKLKNELSSLNEEEELEMENKKGDSLIDKLKTIKVGRTVSNDTDTLSKLSNNQINQLDDLTKKIRKGH